MSTFDPGLPGIHHLCLSVLDLEASLRFYDALLPLLGWLPRRSAGSTAYVSGNTEVSLQTAKEPQHPARRFGVGLQHLAFNVPTAARVDEAYRLVSGLGAEVTDPPAHYPEYSPGYYAVFFKDPSGIQLEVCYTPGHSL